ncbi:MAG: O-antigen ligase [Saprospiraceae bacterium]|nr:O-antigen ligase [Saprospiraceae bacterium]
MTSPIIVFAVIWLVVAALYSLGLSDMLLPIKSETVYLIIASWVLLMLGWSLSSLYSKSLVNLKPDLNIYYKYFGNARREKRVFYFVIGWIFFTLIEIYVYKNLPLLAALDIGVYVKYSEFGFPGIHGLLNAMFFCIISYSFIMASFMKRQRYWVLFILLSLWPVLALSRMMIVATILQVVFLSIILRTKPISFYVFLKYFIIGMSVILLFGYLGDIRNGREHLLELAHLNFEYPDWLPSGFAWVYLYIVTPLNNLNFAIDNYVFIEQFPLEIITRVFPSFLREIIFDLFDRDTATLLVSSAFNISTLFSPIINDFGYILAPMLFLPVGFFSNFLIIKAKSNPRYILFWSVLLYSIVISIFSNHMFHLVYFTEAIFGYLIYGKNKL